MTVNVFVMPGGSGKTTLSAKYNVLDIDVCAMQGRLGEAALFYSQLALKGYITWDTTNSLQWSFLRDVIKELSGEEKLNVLTHTHWAGKFVDADFICHVLPTRQLQRQNIIDREGAYYSIFAKAINDAYDASAATPEYKTHIFNDWSEQSDILKQYNFVLQKDEPEFAGRVETAVTKVKCDWESVSFDIC